MSNELIEKVARAACRADMEWCKGEPCVSPDDDECVEENWNDYVGQATAVVNLILEAAAERADAVKRENAESRDKHEPGIEPGHDDWISYNHGVFTAGEIADDIRALKGESK